MQENDASSSSSDSLHSKGKQRRMRQVPVMEPNLKVKPIHYVLNAVTKYEVLSQVAQNLGWDAEYSLRKGDWDVMWIDHMIEPETLIKMHFFQKISHFPGIQVLARKNLLGLAFNQMQDRFPDHYNFFPKTWLLPNDYPQFRQYVEKATSEKQCYIVKPEADCQGKGIFLTYKTEEVENGKHYVVQQYIHRPFLIDSLKFDLRIYVLLCGINPLRLYFYDEGLARFATEKYEPPTKNNLKKSFMHLTNYAINKKNPKYVYNSSQKNMGTGHKRSMTSVFKEMKRRGFNVPLLKDKIYDILVKTIILGHPLISHQYKFAQPDDYNRNMCFHILGIDIMIDELLNPIVLEVNHTPSFATDTPLDHFIKFNLLKDTLVLLNVNEANKKQMIYKTNNYQRQRITNGKRLVETEEKKQLIAEAQKKRDQFEDSHLGKYIKIYPSQNQIKMAQYEQFLNYTDKNYFSDNNIIRSQIEEEKKKEKDGKKSNSKGSERVSGKNNQIRKKSQLKSSIENQENMKTKNSSSDFFISDLNMYSTNPKNFQNNSHCLSQTEKLKASSLSYGKTQIRITKSISDFQREEMNKLPQPNNRINLVKNLPKIQQSPIIKNSTITVQKGNYTSLRKKKILDSRQDKKTLSKQKEQHIVIGGNGNFVAPKVLHFDNYQEKQIILEFGKGKRFSIEK